MNLWLLHTKTHLYSRRPKGNVWKHAPDYLDLMCEQRFGFPLFGLVSHEVPKRNGSNMTSSCRTKGRVKQGRKEGEVAARSRVASREPGLKPLSMF